MCKRIREYCDDCGSSLKDDLIRCGAGSEEGETCRAGLIWVKEHIIPNCWPCYSKWRSQRIQDLWATEGLLERDQHKLFLSNQPHRVNQHRDKARRARELYYARLDVANALRYTRRQIYALERQYIGDGHVGRQNLQDINLSVSDPAYLLAFQYRIWENGGEEYLDRLLGGASYAGCAAPATTPDNSS